MKKFTIICAILFAVFAVAFGISVAATGVNAGGMSLSFSPVIRLGGFGGGIEFNDNGTETTYKTEAGTFSYDFKGDVYDIDVAAVTAETVIRYGDTTKVEIDYNVKNPTGLSFSAEVKDGRLTVEEKVFSFFTFNMSKSENTLEITLPRKTYNDVEVVNVSGRNEILGLECMNFTGTLTSGTGDYDLYAQNIELNTVSGNLTLTNRTDMRAHSIVLNNTSGNHKISGFLADTIEINTVSGDITAEKISGRTTVNSTSGTVNLDYKEWTNDLEINLVSGDCNVKLPKGSGVALDFDRMSGDVEIDLDGTKTKISSSSEAIYGGSIVHAVEANVMSGDIEISD